MQFVFITYFFYVMFSLWISILFYLKVYMHTPYMLKVYIYTLGVPALFKGVDSDGVIELFSRGVLELPIFNSDGFLKVIFILIHCLLI